MSDRNGYPSQGPYYDDYDDYQPYAWNYSQQNQYTTHPESSYSMTESDFGGVQMQQSLSGSSSGSYGSHNSLHNHYSSSNSSYGEFTVSPSATKFHPSVNVTYGLPINTSSKSSQRKGTSNANQNTGMLHCLHESCEYQTKRQYDLARHQKLHFGSDKKYDCPGKGCGRQGDFAFDRKDHLTEHLRKVHVKKIPKTSRGGKSSKLEER